MTAQLIEPTEMIEVGTVPMLIMGGPGTGKTTLAQTADLTLTLDFDWGIHRASNRKRAMRFSTWQDCVQAGEQGKFDPYHTLVIDTGGRALDTMIPGILKENAKNGYAGNLTPQGWGVLGGRFTTWLKTMQSLGKQLVMLCHQEDAKNTTGEAYFQPDLPGKMSLKEVHKCFDQIGRIRYEGRTRYLDFNPSDNAMGKNAAGWEPLPLPDLHEHPRFLADLLEEARSRLGKTAEASALLAKAVEEWQHRLQEFADDASLNALLPELAGLANGVKRQVWHLFQEQAGKIGLIFNRESKTFVKGGEK